MSNTRDNIPEMDYYELRRQREEYKQRMRMEQNAEKRSADPAVPAQETIEEPVSVQPQPEFIEPRPQAPAAKDAFEEAIEEGYEDYGDEEDFDGVEDEVANPNPFDSFIHFFHGVKSSISARRGDKDADLEDMDDLTEEELDASEADEDEQIVRPMPARVHRRPAADTDADADEADAQSALDIEDALPRRSLNKSNRVETDFDDNDEEFIDDDFEDEDDEDMPRRRGGFKKFMGLFVERMDEDDDEDDGDADADDFDDLIDPRAAAADEYEDDIDEDDEDIDDAAPRRKGLFGRRSRKGRKDREDFDDVEDAQDEDIFPIRRTDPFPEPEGGYTMEEIKKPTPDSQQAAPAAESTGMTRRERRELAMRLAAEEAARKAAEEAARKAAEEAARKAAEEEKAAQEEKPIAIEPLFSDAEPQEEKVDMAAFEDAPKADILVETTAEETVDEPTRKFTPVSMRDVQEAEKEDLFAVDESEDEDEDDEDEDEIVEKKPRRGLFGRRKSKPDDDEDDDEDEDDEDEYDDDSDSDDDDDDEYDEYDDDEEDEDEYDDNDEYDDEDEPRRSFGHHLIGIFKVILGIVLALLVVVIVFNFLYVGGQSTIVDKMHGAMGDSAAFRLLFPSYSIRASMPVEEDEPEVLPQVEITAEPTALPEPEATVAIPNLDGGAAGNDADVITAPVIESAPVVQEAPAAGSVG